MHTRVVTLAAALGVAGEEDVDPASGRDAVGRPVGALLGAALPGDLGVELEVLGHDRGEAQGLVAEAGADLARRHLADQLQAILANGI